MYVISGATGRVGSAVVRTLLAHNQPVTALSRSGRAVPAVPGAPGAPGALSHAATIPLDLADSDALAGTLSGAAGFFALLPFDDTLATPGRAERLIDSITHAVERSGVGHVVLLSSGGADVPPDAGTPTGPIADLYKLEQRLKTTGATITALRCCHFQEKFTDTLDAARHTGVHFVLASTAHRPIHMVATADVGRIAAETLLNPPTTSEVIDVLGPEYTEADVAATLSRALGSDVRAECVPEVQWQGVLEAAGLPNEAAVELAAMYRADEAGLLAPRAARSWMGDTRLNVVVDRVLGGARR